jgi:hypothetical protein
MEVPRNELRGLIRDTKNERVAERRETRNWLVRLNVGAGAERKPSHARASSLNWPRRVPLTLSETGTDDKQPGDRIDRKRQFAGRIDGYVVLVAVAGTVG